MPYLKPFGCPYGPGDAVDYQDYYKSGPWLPAQVVEVDEDCGMNIVYQGADGVEVPLEVPGVYFGVSFRPPELALKTDTELAADKATAADALLCQLDGQTLADITGTDRDADIRRAVLSEMATRFGASRMVVDFINIRAGRSFRVEDGSTFFSKHTDAALGEEAHNIRVQSRVCAEYGTRPAESAERQDDYVCYISNFDEFLCAP